jgi:MFS family permease
MTDAYRPGPRLATRLAFVVAGFTTACWAPLIPFAKARLDVNDAELGLLLLSFGIGSLIGVSAAGLLAARIGARPIVVAGGIGLCALLPALAVAGSPLSLGAPLFLFGASIGALDVAMNAHGVEVERAAGAPLMSGFHALFSLGGFAGAGWMTLALSVGLSPLIGTFAAALTALCLVAVGAAGLLRTRPARHERLLVWPTGLVVVIAVLAATMFLAEGAVFDWGALLIVDRRLAGAADAGLGYILFSIAMTAGRLSGDAIVRRLGALRVLRWGGALAVAGLVLV